MGDEILKILAESKKIANDEVMNVILKVETFIIELMNQRRSA